MSVFVLLENTNFWKKHQIFPPCSFMNLMKNMEISVTFKRINVTVSRSGNTVPFLQLVSCRYSTHTHTRTTSFEAYVKSSRLYKTMNVIY